MLPVLIKKRRILPIRQGREDVYPGTRAFRADILYFIPARHLDERALYHAIFLSAVYFGVKPLPERVRQADI
jgi:hypothetical protein